MRILEKERKDVIINIHFELNKKMIFCVIVNKLGRRKIRIIEFNRIVIDNVKYVEIKIEEAKIY